MLGFELIYLYFHLGIKCKSIVCVLAENHSVCESEAMIQSFYFSQSEDRICSNKLIISDQSETIIIHLKVLLIGGTEWIICGNELLIGGNKLLICWPRWLSWMCIRLLIRRLRVCAPPVQQHSFVEIDHEILSTVSFSAFCWFKKGICRFLVKECAQFWLTT